MTIQTFCRSGQQEDVKGAVHAIAGMQALAMATYNITCARPAISVFVVGWKTWMHNHTIAATSQGRLGWLGIFVRGRENHIASATREMAYAAIRIGTRSG